MYYECSAFNWLLESRCFFIVSEQRTVWVTGKMSKRHSFFLTTEKFLCFENTKRNTCYAHWCRLWCCWMLLSSSPLSFKARSTLCCVPPFPLGLMPLWPQTRETVNLVLSTFLTGFCKCCKEKCWPRWGKCYYSWKRAGKPHHSKSAGLNSWFETGKESSFCSIFSNSLCFIISFVFQLFFKQGQHCQPWHLCLLVATTEIEKKRWNYSWNTLRQWKGKDIHLKCQL